MRYSLFVILIGCILILTTAMNCDPVDDPPLASITIKNNTSNTIGYYYKEKLNINDTILPEGKPNFDVSYYYNGLNPYSFKTIYISPTHSISDLQTYMNTYVLFCYFFNYDSINSLPWSQIREKNIYMKRVIIDTQQDLEKCENEIAFP